MRSFLRFVAAIAVMCVVASRGFAQPLPVDPRLVSGELTNGMRYFVMEHANPPGRAAIYLHVSAGSLNETDRQRGIAHFLEHMAFNGSENFPPGKVVPFFESMGLTFGQHQNAFTSFNQTAYQLELPNNEDATIAQGMLFMSDIAFGLLLPQEEIENERQVILEEKRTRANAQQRVFDVVLERIAPGSLVGERLPIGTEETLLSMNQKDFQDFYRSWYVPSNMAVIVVADTPAEPVVEMIRARFSKGARTPQPADPDPRVRHEEGRRSIVVTDAELTDAEISINRIAPAGAPVATEAEYRREMVERVGMFAFNRRLDKILNDGNAAYLTASGASGEYVRAIRWTSVTASGPAAAWPDMLQQASTEVRRAAIHGFSQREVDDALHEITASAERAVETEETRPAGAVISYVNDSLADERPPMSAAQELEVLRRVLPTITREEVSSTFGRIFDFAACTFILQMPTTGQVPTEQELTEFGAKALEVTPGALVEEERPTTILAEIPAPGELVQIEHHAASDVWSGWLSNGVRMHFRKMDYRKDSVAVVITIAGGHIQETKENRGITDAAALVFGRPATSRLSSTNVRDLMTGKKVEVNGRPQLDSLAISITGSPADLEAGLQLAHALLTDPKLEAPAFDNWRQTQRQLIAANKMEPGGAFREVFWSTILSPDEVRVKPLTVEQVDRLSLEAAQAWITRLVREGPAEVAVVGDIEKDRAIELARTYVGSLPARARITDSTLAEARTAARQKGPRIADVAITSQTDKAVAMGGFFIGQAKDVTARRLMTVASNILTSRMNKVIREEKQLVYSIQASSGPAIAYPEVGLFTAAGFTDPGKAAELVKVIDEMYAEFLSNGPTAEEMETVKKQIANTLDETLREPAFWTSQLADMSYRGTSLDDLMGEAAAFQGVTGDQVKGMFARYCTPENKIQIIVRQAPSENKDQPKPPAG